MMVPGLLRVPDVARRLSIEGVEVYRLIERGELEAGKGKDGFVYVREESLAAYQTSHTARS